MNEVSIDKSQIIGEVKERNKFYRALVKIQEISKASSNSKDTMLKMEEIGKVCQDALKDII